MFANVEFPSQGAVLRGRLYRPAGSAPVPLVVMAHGTSATTTMTTDRYSAAEVIVVGAVDERPAGAIAQIPAIGPHLPPPDPDGALFSALRDTLPHGPVGGGATDTTRPLPVVSADQRGTPSLLTPIQAFRWFIEYGGRHGTNWQNEVTRVLPATLCPFHAGIAAPHLNHPLLMLIAPEDEMQGANPEVSRAAYASVHARKELVEIRGGHFGLLHHPSKLFDEASTVQKDFLVRTLVDPVPA